jgi:hypothetical protein
VQEERGKQGGQNVLAGDAAYANPPSIHDTMRQDDGSDPAAKVDPVGKGAIGFAGAAVLVVALIAGAVGLNNSEAPKPPQVRARAPRPAANPPVVLSSGVRMHASTPRSALRAAAGAGAARFAATVRAACQLQCFVLPRDSWRLTVMRSCVQLELSEQARGALQERLKGFEETLASSPRDTEALEGAGVTEVELGDYSKARAAFCRMCRLKRRP